MGAFLSGFLGAAAKDINTQADRSYQEKRQERQDRMRILELAASNPNTKPDALPKIFEELDDLAKESGYKSPTKRSFAEAGGIIGQILGRRGQQQQQQAGAQQARADVRTAPGPTVAPGGGAPPMAPPAAAAATPGPPASPAATPPFLPQQQQQPQPQRPVTPPMPQSRFGGMFYTQPELEQRAETEFQTGLKHKRAETRAQTEADKERADSLAQYFKSQGMDDRAARDEADRVVFMKGKAPAAHNLSQVLYKTPTDEEPKTGWADPREPGVVYDAANGQRLEAGTFTVLDKTLASTEARGKYWGEFGNYYRAMRGRGMNDADAMRAAGDMVAQKYGVHLSRTQQQLIIDQLLSGVGGGGGLPPSARAPAGAGAGAPTAARPGAMTPPLPPRRTTAAAAGGTPLTGGGLTSRENEDVLYYLGTLTGTQKGLSKAAQVRAQNGLRTISRVTGLDPTTLTARLTETPALAKQIGETVQRSGAIQRLNNTIDAHGKVLEDVAKNVADSGSPLLNAPIREWRRRLAGSPELKRFDVARNEIQREYAYLTAGGAQSRAMLPVTTSQNMDKLLSDDVTIPEAAAIVDQIRIGARTEQQAMQKTVQDLQRQMMMGPAGQATGATGATTPPPAANRPQVRILSVQ
jgi:hypothetical protein